MADLDQSYQSFAGFIAEAEPLMSVWPSRRAAFADLAEPAARVVAGYIRASLQANRLELEELCRWIVTPEADVFSAAGLAGNEVACTRLVSWMLHPPNEPQIALLCQRAWLSKLGRRDIGNKLKAPAVPALELHTEDGRADLVLDFERPDYLLIVEAKLGTEEHETPSGSWQTAAYPAAVRARLGLPPDHPGDLVFLTPNGQEGEDANAIAATYEGLITAVTSTLGSLPPSGLSQELRWAYAAISTHLLNQAAPSGMSFSVTLQTVVRPWLNREATLTDARILSNVRMLGRLCRLLTSKRS